MNQINERFYRKLKLIAAGSFCIGLGLFLVSKVLSSVASNDMKESNLQSTNSYQVLVQSNNVELQLQSVQNHFRGYMLTGDSLFKNAYDQSVRQADDSYTTLFNLLKGRNDQDSQVQNLGFLINNLKDHTREWIQMKDAEEKERMEQAMGRRKGKKIMDALMYQTSLIKEREEKVLQSRIKQSKKVHAIVDQFSLASSILASAFLLVSFLFIYNSLRKKERMEKNEADFNSGKYDDDLLAEGPPHLNYDRLVEGSLGDNKFVKEMLIGYLDHVPTLIADMERCLLPEGEEELRSIAHKLRSASQVVDLTGINTDLERIELFPRGGNDREEMRILQVRVCKTFKAAFPLIEEKIRQL